MSVGSIFTNYFSQTPPLPTIDNKNAFITALNGKDFCRQLTELKNFFSKLTPEDQDDYLKEITTEGFTSNNQELLNRCLDLLDFEGMQSLLTQVYGEMAAFNECIQRRTNHMHLHLSQINLTQSDLKQGIPYLYNLVVSFINTLIYATSLLELGKQPESAWDANFQLQVYYQLLAIPLGLFFALQKVITNPVLVAAAFSGSFLGLLSSVYVYLRWLQPPPITLPYATNLTQAVKEGRIGPVVGRTVELLSSTQRITSHSNEIRQHLYLHGKTGVGKNELIDGIAYELFHNKTGQIPPHFRNKQVFYLDASSLSNKNSFKNTTPLEELEAAIGKHADSIILVIDEAQALLNDEKAKESIKTRLNNSSFSVFRHVILLSSTDHEALLDPDIRSRLAPFKLEEMKEDQIVEVLNKIAATSDLDVAFTRDKLKAFIKPSTGSDLQPTPAKRNLIQALNTIQANWDGNSLQKDLYQLTQELTNLKSQIPAHVNGSELIGLKDLFTKIQIKEKETQTQIQKIESFKKTVETFKDMKKRGNHIEAELPSLIGRVQTPNWKDRRQLTALKLQYLFIEYYLLSAKDRAIQTFAENNGILTSLKEVLPDAPPN